MIRRQQYVVHRVPFLVRQRFDLQPLTATGDERFQEYETATLGWDIDYAQVIHPKPGDASMGKQLEIIRVRGNPDYSPIGTSYVERYNLTIRQQVRRFTRKTLAFSKKLPNLRAAVAPARSQPEHVRGHIDQGAWTNSSSGIPANPWS